MATANLLGPDMALGRTGRGTGLIAGIAAMALLLCAAPVSSAAVRWVAKGHGFGHGAGMSQYGAYGYAIRGVGYETILKHYFQGTTLEAAPAQVVRVLLTISGGDVGFRKASAACGRNLNPDHSYRARLSGGNVRLLSRHGRPLANCGSKLRAHGGGRVTISGLGPYRGALEVVPTSGGGSLNVIDALTVDKYVQGVIAAEMPPSWPLEALKVQAVAARSYALSTGVDGNGFELYDDARSQVYRGIRGETGRTNRAASATTGQVLEYGGEIARTYYSACSGGQTENVEFAFIGSDPIPYLKGVDDPYDGSCPLHTWKRVFSARAIASRLGVPGRLKAVDVTQRGVSPRIVWAKLVGTAGTKKLRGDKIQSALGLYSTWVRFQKIR